MCSGSGNGSSTQIGKTNGANGLGSSRVPLSQALPQYQSQATRALDGANIPPSVRELVRQYFSGLGNK
jgi:hypothetical protein